MNPIQRGNLVLAVVTAIGFLATGFFITHWGGPLTIVGALCVFVVVFRTSEWLTRSRQDDMSGRR